jgi:iron(III) transport system substrate-binding protein
MIKRFTVIFLLALLLPALTLAAQDSGESLVVYSGRTEGLIGPLLERFSAETGIRVEVRYGGTAEMAATILEEGANSPADVFIAQDAGALGALAQAGRLRALPSDILERVDPRFASPVGLWVGLSGRARVLVYNPDTLTADQLPLSLLDLTAPEWAGRVGWSPTNGSFQAHVTALRVLLGEDGARAWLEGMVANGAVPYENNRAVVQAVADGEVEVGLVNHYYLYAMQADNPGLAAANYYFPAGDAGALVNVAGAGILDTSAQPGLAQRFVLYLLGAGAQTYFAQQTFEYPLAAGVAPAAALPPLDSIETPALDLSDLSDLQTTLDLLRDTGALP